MAHFTHTGVAWATPGALFLVGVGVSFLPLAIRVVVDGTLKYVCHPPRLLRSSGARLLVSLLGALMLGCCDCRIGLP